MHEQHDVHLVDGDVFSDGDHREDGCVGGGETMDSQMDDPFGLELVVGVSE